MIWRHRARIAAWIDLLLTLISGGYVFYLMVELTRVDGMSYIFKPLQLSKSQLWGILFLSTFYIPIGIEIWGIMRLIWATSKEIDAAKSLEFSKLWRNITILMLILQCGLLIPAKMAWPFIIFTLRLGCLFTITMYRDETERLINHQTLLTYHTQNQF